MKKISFSSIGILRKGRMKNELTHTHTQIECFHVKNIYMYKDQKEKEIFVFVFENRKNKKKENTDVEWRADI